MKRNIAIITCAAGAIMAANAAAIDRPSATATKINLPSSTLTIDGNKPLRGVNAHKTPTQGSFFESFEYDGTPQLWNEATADLGWLPDGWSRKSVTDNAPGGQWYAYPMEAYLNMPCYDENYVMAVLFDSEYKDQWLVSPEVELGSDRYLTFGWYAQPLYFWTVDRNHVDYEAGVFTNRELAATMAVMISVDGGDWEVLKDMSDDYASMDYSELLEMSYGMDRMQECRISLDDYAGHKAQFAFRYFGADGDSMFIDGVSVNNGVAQTNALYLGPLSGQYLGGTKDMDILDAGVQYLPSRTPLYWYNMSQNDTDVRYVWEYDGLPVVDEDEYCLEVEFPEPTGADGEKYDIYMSPTLIAEGESPKAGRYNENVYLMVGGDATVDGSKYGLLPFDCYGSGLYYHTIEPEDFGEYGTPIFGYDKNTDAYWQWYTCGGDESNYDSIPYAYISGIINGVVPSESPLTVNGAWVYAIGRITDQAHFTCSIYALDEDGAFVEPPVATKTISGAEVLKPDQWMSMDYLSLPFAFDEPVVLDADGTEGDFYAVMLTGFHDGGVEYFAPFMQSRPNPCELCLGFYQIEFMYKGTHQVGLSYVANHQNDYGDMYCAFAINLDASYTSGQDGVAALAADGAEVVECYDLMGRSVRLGNNAPGIYIQRDANGNCRKVVRRN